MLRFNLITELKYLEALPNNGWINWEVSIKFPTPKCFCVCTNASCNEC